MRPHIILGVDASGSMGNGSGSEWEAACIAFDHALEPIREFSNTPLVSAFAFSDNAHPIYGRVPADGAPLLGSLSNTHGGGTAIHRSTLTTLKKFYKKGEPTLIVIFTDGGSNTPYLDELNKFMEDEGRENFTYVYVSPTCYYGDSAMPANWDTLTAKDLWGGEGKQRGSAPYLYISSSNGYNMTLWPIHQLDVPRGNRIFTDLNPELVRNHLYPSISTCIEQFVKRAYSEKPGPFGYAELLDHEPVFSVQGYDKYTAKLPPGSGGWFNRANRTAVDAVSFQEMKAEVLK